MTAPTIDVDNTLIITIAIGTLLEFILEISEH